MLYACESFEFNNKMGARQYIWMSIGHAFITHSWSVAFELLVTDTTVCIIKYFWDMFFCLDLTICSTATFLPEIDYNWATKS